MSRSAILGVLNHLRGGGGAPPPCEQAPPGSSQKTIDCYNGACVLMQAEYAACNGNKLCEIGVLADYYEAIEKCDAQPGQ